MKNILFICCLILLLFACKKEPSLPGATNKVTIPTVKTAEVTSITVNAAACGGEVTDDGNGTVTARGVCWDTQADPSLSNNIGYTADGTGTGAFDSEIIGLTANTNYYYVAYATNEKGTSYGEIKIFQTIPITLPTVTTSGISQLTPTSATAGGNVENDGNGNVIARGVCWDTQPNPSLEQNAGYTTDGDGTGEFTSNLTGLTIGVTYYYTAYATNEKGCAYGEVKDFITPIPCGELTVDYGGQTYHTVLIGDQCWMKENLNIGSRINGSQEQTNNGTIEKYCYGDNEASCDEYGGLYQWNEMMKYTSQQGTQGICPDGWHIPTDGEWTILTDFLGGEAVAGGKMKETGTAHWNSPNTGASNSSGFTGLPGGNRASNGSFYNVGNYGNWWSSTEHSSTSAWYRYLNYSGGTVTVSYYSKQSGISVRCLRD